MGDVILLSQKKRLQQQCDKINDLSRKSKSKYQRAIFIHLDSRSEKQRIDVFFYHHAKSKRGEQLAKILKTTFQEHYDKHQPARGFSGTVSSRELFVLAKTKPVAVFAELGNIQNSFDQRRFLLSSNRQALANWMCRGIIRDYEKSKGKNYY
jgi:N-acetylmuramoyl-L-alanine amidase